MRPLKFPALPRATLLWLAVALGSALLYYAFLAVQGMPPLLTAFTAFLTFAIAVALGFGLPMSLLMPLIAPPLAGASCRYDLQRVLVFFVGGAFAVLSLFLFDELPTTPWERATPTPEPMVEFMTTLPPDFAVEGVFARGASGQLYNYDRVDCRPDCAWTARAALPAPPDPAEDWPGKCGRGHTGPYGLGLTPPPPQRSITLLSTKFCGVDGSSMTYYLLDDDGMVWRWKRVSSGSEGLTLLFCTAPLLFFLGSFVALAWAYSAD